MHFDLSDRFQIILKLDTNRFVTHHMLICKVFVVYSLLTWFNVNCYWKFVFYRSSCHCTRMLNGRAPVSYGGWIQYGGGCGAGSAREAVTTPKPANESWIQVKFEKGGTVQWTKGSVSLAFPWWIRTIMARIPYSETVLESRLIPWP